MNKAELKRDYLDTICTYIAVVLSDDFVECRDQGTFVFQWGSIGGHNAVREGLKHQQLEVWDTNDLSLTTILETTQSDTLWDRNTWIARHLLM